MKNQNNFKTALFPLVIMSALFIFSFCVSDEKPKDTKDVAIDLNEAKFPNKGKERDALFLVNAAGINLLEIQLGELAQQNYSMPDVSALGKMMADEHGRSLKELISLANKKKMSIPTSLTDKALVAVKNLESKSGKVFDKEYCEMMVNGHQSAILLFENAAADCNDSEIGRWAKATILTLRIHLERAIECQKKCETFIYSK